LKANIELSHTLGHKQSFEQTKKRSECANFVRIIASIEDPMVIRKILTHLDEKAPSVAAGLLPDCRDPPMRLLI